MSLKHKIQETFETAGPVLTPQGLIHLGSRAAVDQALSRLTREGVLARIERGVYVAKLKSRFGIRLPAVHEIVAHLKQVTGETVVPHGAAEANRLGLSTQVPVRQVFLTSGPSRQLMIGSQTVELHHASSWELLPGRLGSSIRALSILNGSELRTHVAGILGQLSEAERQELWEIRMQLPTRLLTVLLPYLVEDHVAA